MCALLEKLHCIRLQESGGGGSNGTLMTKYAKKVHNVKVVSTFASFLYLIRKPKCIFFVFHPSVLASESIWPGTKNQFFCGEKLVALFVCPP